MDSISGRNILVQVLRQHWKSKFKIVYKNYEFISNFFLQVVTSFFWSLDLELETFLECSSFWD